MWIIIAALAVGGIIGYMGLLPESCQRLTGSLMTLGIMFLLFIMGGQIGSDEMILSALGIIGAQALLFAAGAIIGSIAAVKILLRIFPGKTETAVERGGSE